jgi:hypothetical protein
MDCMEEGLEVVSELILIIGLTQRAEIIYKDFMRDVRRSLNWTPCGLWGGSEHEVHSEDAGVCDVRTPSSRGDSWAK